MSATELDISPLAPAFGAEITWVELDQPQPGFERIVLLQIDAGNPPGTEGWHTDLGFKDEPPFAKRCMNQIAVIHDSRPGTALRAVS